MKIRWLFWILAPLIAVNCETERKIKSEINPGCKSCNSPEINLIYVRATGEWDIIHNIWDFTNGKPTFIIIVSGLNTTMNFTWDDNKATSMELSDKPTYSFGIVVDKLWEYNDAHDAAMFNVNDTSNVAFDMADMQWNKMELEMTDTRVSIRVSANSYGTGVNRRKCDLSLRLQTFSFPDHSVELPHLIHTANSSLVDIVLENLETTKGFNASRFAIELALIGTEKSNKLIYMTIRKGLDDEHTPGVFEIIELMTPDSVEGGKGAFIQYRPVAYTKSRREVAASTKVETGDLSQIEIPENTIAKNYFDDLHTHTLAERLIISLGGKDDGFYKKTHYNAWSFSYGYGNPPPEKISLLILLIMSIGLGVPLLLIVSGGIFVCVRRRVNSNHNRLVEE